MTSYPTPEFRRTALAPGILGAIVLLAGLALLDNAAVSILALIMCVFSWQGKQWWWIIALLAIAVLWNPVAPFAFHGQGWVALQFVGAIVFIVVGLRVKIKNPDDRNQRR
jgi:hypothetical protein